jgi:tRNA-dihydrouridine synthase A
MGPNRRNEYGKARAQPAEMEAKSKNFSRFAFSVAPMMDWTDRHCRYFHRLLTRNARLYTEMIGAEAVIYGDRCRLIGFNDAEHPLAVQLGGSNPGLLARAAAICGDFGYDEVNLNVGCPSERVQVGRFGACLMAEPELVAECVSAMKARVGVPVTVKCRLGIDDQDPEEALEVFVQAVESAGADEIIVHARKAWLQGLSPKENRDIPPLDYGRVRRLKAAHPHLRISLNGGIESVADAQSHLAVVDGVMMGRLAYRSPALLFGVDPLLFREAAPYPSIFAALEALVPYIELERDRGTPVHAITRHVLGIFNGMPGARAFRRHLAMHALDPGGGGEVLREAVAKCKHLWVKLDRTAA